MSRLSTFKTGVQWNVGGRGVYKDVIAVGAIDTGVCELEGAWRGELEFNFSDLRSAS